MLDSVKLNCMRGTTQGKFCMFSSGEGGKEGTSENFQLKTVFGVRATLPPGSHSSKALFSIVSSN